MKPHDAGCGGDQKIITLRLIYLGLEGSYLWIRVVLVCESHDGNQRTACFLIFEKFSPDIIDLLSGFFYCLLQKRIRLCSWMSY